jgi:hypothetical protein
VTSYQFKEFHMTAFALTEYKPLNVVPTKAIQFTGELDEDSTSPTALAVARTTNPARTPDTSLTGTFLGFPVRSEPYRHVPQAAIPAPVHATLHLAPDTVPAVLVQTPSGGHPAFPGDWIVQATDGTYSVWTDAKFRAEFNVPEADGSGTGRYGAHGNWTEHGDGTDYPSEGASYGVPQNKPFVPLDADAPDAPIVPAAEAFAAPSSDPLVVGSSFRILRADQSVDPAVHVATAVHGGLVTYYESAGVTAQVSRGHVVPVKAEHDILA